IISEQNDSMPTQKETENTIIENIENDEPIAQQEPEYNEPELIITEPEPIITEPETEPPVNTIYNDGVYTAEEFGYDSMVTITITIENDIITDMTATCNESDMYYFEEAYPVIKNRILNSQTPEVDTVSGSTYSSNAIITGVQKALESARK
ncbi:MAG: FMN-binding protein, partial [Oscillospiraceae bacterium]|nr:FMN-binding protein [Oscillospiraceae bacterium]